MNERFGKCFGSLMVSAGWDGADLPTVGSHSESGYLRVTELGTNRIILERTDALARRIGWLLQHAEGHPETIDQWNCFATVRLAAGKTQRLTWESLAVERGTPVANIIEIAEKAGEPFVFDWIHVGHGHEHSVAVHTGIVLGMDPLMRNPVVFEKRGKDYPRVCYWTVVEQRQRAQASYVTWTYFDHILSDPDPTGVDYGEGEMGLSHSARRRPAASPLADDAGAAAFILPPTGSCTRPVPSRGSRR